MKRVLFISSFHPGAKGSIGAGEAICGDNLKKFLDQNIEVDVIVSAPQSQRKNDELSIKCHSYSEVPTSRFKYLLGILYNTTKGSWLAPWFYTRVTKKIVLKINELMSNNDYDLVWLDFPSVLGMVTYIKHPNIHYFAHDIVSQRVSRTNINRFTFPFVGHVERNLLKSLNSIVTMSEKDKELIERLGCNIPTFVADLGAQKVGQVDNAVNVYNILPQFKDKYNIVFFGNMMRSENHWSIVWFIFFHFFKLKKAKPNLNLWVLGLNPRYSLKILGKISPSIHVVGAVDDPIPAFISANLNIAPLLYGAGVKIKVLQVLDAGGKVVATPIGAEGIKQHENLYVVEKSEFGKKILELMD